MTGVLAGVAAATVLAALTADPAQTVMDMPVPPDQLLPPFPETESSCCWGLDDIDPLRALAMVTLCVMVCHVMLWSAFRIVRLASAFVAEEIAWLMSRRR